MKLLCHFTFLYGLSFVTAVAVLNCKESQYRWPVKNPQLCCEMCPPGKFLDRRNEEDCQIECKLCTGDYYMSSYNVEMSCNICENCNKSNMEYKSYCNGTHNAVCKCKDGYRCIDQECKECEPIPSTTQSTTASSTSAPTTAPETTPDGPVSDTAWFPIIACLLCTAITVLLLTRVKPFLHWIRSKHGYLLANKPTPVTLSSVDEEVSKPVQEVCGICEKPLEV